MAESYAGAESVTAAAKRHGLRHTQLFTWRREMRRADEAAGVTLPVAVEPVPVAMVAPAPKKKRVWRPRPGAAVELVIAGVVVKIARGSDAGVIAAVIDALKTK